MALASPVHSRELDALDAMIGVQEAALIARTRHSHELHREASAHLPAGVASSWQDAPPCPVFVERGIGSRLWDVDGTEYVDLHGGFGTMLTGHGHPAIVAAVRARVGAGTHFAQPVPDIIPVARELARRFGLPMWRFTNSGTEATMAAVHLMRAATGRPQIIKVEGSYHGHHDAVQVSVYPEGEAAGPGRPTEPRARARRRRPRNRRPHPCRPVRAARRSAPGAARPPRPDRRDDRRAGDDEHRRRPTAARLPRRPRPSAAHPRGAADVRRGQDRSGDRAGRGRRALRRRAGHRLPGQGARWRRAVRRRSAAPPR